MLKSAFFADFVHFYAFETIRETHRLEYSRTPSGRAKYANLRILLRFANSASKFIQPQKGGVA